LQKQIKAIKEEYLFSEGYAKYLKEQKIKPVYNEWTELMLLIKKAENETNIRL
jgi:hypothetical protein